MPVIRNVDDDWKHDEKGRPKKPSGKPGKPGEEEDLLSFEGYPGPGLPGTPGGTGGGSGGGNPGGSGNPTRPPPEDPVQTFADFFNDMTVGNPAMGLQISLSGNIEKDLDNLGLSSNAEGITFLGCAYAASELPGSNVIRSFLNFDDIHITALFPRDYEPEMTGEGANQVMVRGGANGTLPSYINRNKSPNDGGDYNVRLINLCPDEAMKSLFKKVHGGLTDWKYWFVHLLASHQTKPLTPGHVSSFCAMMGSTGVEGVTFAKLFSGLSSGMPGVNENRVLRNLLSDNKWVSYRTTFASAIGLLKKMIDECPASHIGILSLTTINHIRDAHHNKYSETAYRMIPEKALGVLVAYLMVTKELPVPFYGPQRAYDALQFHEKESLHNWFTDARKHVKVWTKAGFGNVNPQSLPASLRDI